MSPPHQGEPPATPARGAGSSCSMMERTPTPWPRRSAATKREPHDGEDLARGLGPPGSTSRGTGLQDADAPKLKPKTLDVERFPTIMLTRDHVDDHAQQLATVRPGRASCERRRERGPSGRSRSASGRTPRIASPARTSKRSSSRTRTASRWSRGRSWRCSGLPRGARHLELPDEDQSSTSPRAAASSAKSPVKRPATSSKGATSSLSTTSAAPVTTTRGRFCSARPSSRRGGTG